jgi:NAD(P)-dependent dehydrogenase (short-subunit alcohol dehydrogenase family)
MTMSNLKGKVTLITGGTSGFGKETARLFAGDGAQVIVASIDGEDVLKSVQKEIGCQHTFHMDVTRANDWDRVYQFVKDRFGRLDFLLNIAGGGVSILPTADQPIEKIDYCIALNLNSAIYGSRAFAKMMMAQKSGTIVNFASVCAKEAWPDWSVYAAAKWGVLGFTKGLFTELQPHNVRAICIIPAAASTGFQRAAGIGPVDLKLRPQDVAQVVYDVCNLPEHVVVEDVTVWGIDQVVVPLSR